MSRIKGKNTKPEIKLRSLLHSSGFRFRTHDTKLPGKPDIVMRKYKTVIFVHGCFWHRHANCRYATMPNTNTNFWHAKFNRTKERDKENYQSLKLMGWKYIVIWECKIKKGNTGYLKNRLQKFLRMQPV